MSPESRKEKIMKAMKLDRWQGDDQHDRPFGYIAIGDGGYFVTWHDDSMQAKFEPGSGMAIGPSRPPPC